MRTAAEIDAEEWVLSTAEGQRLLELTGAVQTPGPSELAQWRRAHRREVVEAAIRLADARRRGAAKFSRADRMWLDPVGLEQATAECVAVHKARRFNSEFVVDVCSGIGGDSLALGARGRVIGVDADEGMCRRLRWNAGVYGVADRVQVVCTRANEFPLRADAFVHIDPDRRARSSRRAQALTEYEPDLGFLQSLIERTRGGALKLGPASDFENHFGHRPVEIEVISLRGECKEATVWYGELTTCRWRATVLPSGESWSDRDHDRSATLPCSEVSRWVFDPDPALVRAGLVASFGSAHRLGRVSHGVDYLTGPERVDTPFLSAFEVREALPLDLKRLKRVIAAHRIGPLEIKVRGLRLSPDALRAQLRPPGPNPATLLLAGGAGQARAILAERPQAMSSARVGATRMEPR